YSRLAATIGVDDATDSPDDAVRFLAYADGVVQYDSGPRRRGDPPVEVDVDLVGVQAVRLVAADERLSERPLYADWADVRLLRPALGTPLTDPARAQQVRAEIARRTARRAEDDRALAQRGEYLRAELDKPAAASPLPLGEGTGEGEPGRAGASGAAST